MFDPRKLNSGSRVNIACTIAFAIAGAAAVVVGRLDQQPAAVGGARLGDRPQPALLAAGALAGDDPEVGRELVGMIKPAPLADLRAQPDRRQRSLVGRLVARRSRRAREPLLKLYPPTGTAVVKSCSWLVRGWFQSG